MIKKYSHDMPGPIGSVLQQYDEIKSETGSDLYDNFYQDHQMLPEDNDDMGEVASEEQDDDCYSVIDIHHNNQEISPIREALGQVDDCSPIIERLQPVEHLSSPEVLGYNNDNSLLGKIIRKRDIKRTKKAANSHIDFDVQGMFWLKYYNLVE
jgi:hypothetical protein